MKTEQFYNHTRISDQTNNVKKLSIDEKVNKKASQMELQKSEDTEFCFSRLFPSGTNYANYFTKLTASLVFSSASLN